MNRKRITVKKIEGEWAAVWYEGRQMDEAKTYFTGGDDRDAKQDAIDTAEDMRRRAGIE